MICWKCISILQFILFYFISFPNFCFLMLREWVIHSSRLIQGMCVVYAVILCMYITFAPSPHLWEVLSYAHMSITYVAFNIYIWEKFNLHSPTYRKLRIMITGEPLILLGEIMMTSTNISGNTYEIVFVKDFFLLYKQLNFVSFQVTSLFWT